MPVLDGGQAYVEANRKFDEANQNLTKCKKRIKELEFFGKQRPQTTREKERLLNLKQKEEVLQQKHDEANSDVNYEISRALA